MLFTRTAEFGYEKGAWHPPLTMIFYPETNIAPHDSPKFRLTEYFLRLFYLPLLSTPTYKNIRIISASS